MSHIPMPTILDAAKLMLEDGGVPHTVFFQTAKQPNQLIQLQAEEGDGRVIGAMIDFVAYTIQLAGDTLTWMAVASDVFMLIDTFKGPSTPEEVKRQAERDFPRGTFAELFEKGDPRVTEAVVVIASDRFVDDSLAAQYVRNPDGSITFGERSKESQPIMEDGLIIRRLRAAMGRPMP